MKHPRLINQKVTYAVKGAAHGYLWPPDVVLHVDALASHEGWTEPQIARAKTILREPRLMKTAKWLHKNSFTPRTIAEFLGKAIELPEHWETWRKKPKESLLTELNDLQRSAEKLLALLDAHRVTSTQLLEEDHTADNHPQTPGGYDNLVILTRKLRENALSLRLRIEPVKVPHVDPRRQKLNYFVQELVAHSRSLFGRPMHGSIGVLATVCLGLKSELQAYEVIEICTYRRLSDLALHDSADA